MNDMKEHELLAGELALCEMSIKAQTGAELTDTHLAKKEEKYVIVGTDMPSMTFKQAEHWLESAYKLFIQGV